MTGHHAHTREDAADATAGRATANCDTRVATNRTVRDAFLQSTEHGLVVYPGPIRTSVDDSGGRRVAQSGARGCGPAQDFPRHCAAASGPWGPRREQPSWGCRRPASASLACPDWGF